MVFLKEITLQSTAIYVQFSVMIIIMIIINIQDSKARELRPSDHGLGFQSMPPTAVKFPPDMKQFFGASSAATSYVVFGGCIAESNELERHLVVENCWCWRRRRRRRSCEARAVGSELGLWGHGLGLASHFCFDFLLYEA
ncbi:CONCANAVALIN A-LIKE LECTIN/GLUCANASE DOMAIN-CONTAINING PROTEIN-RELATED [Salix purpurea]|uniref:CONCANAVALIN A-LIKE LECTIN/GLUCANASE DOMAIN-CONTAINING PROTEIN-RELATED n=1 Tax=Salix purpurea TaxID=77065 RepID=A0A9Q1A136_SALPP|nr:CONCANAVALIN A-LIKE LECTIN/GLUCANASE DOMAIN-CONTAINING PROTEIN-RELATED [Salix purpurea]